MVATGVEGVARIARRHSIAHALRRATSINE